MSYTRMVRRMVIIMVRVIVVGRARVSVRVRASVGVRVRVRVRVTERVGGAAARNPVQTQASGAGCHTLPW